MVEMGTVTVPVKLEFEVDPRQTVHALASHPALFDVLVKAIADPESSLGYTQSREPYAEWVATAVIRAIQHMEDEKS